MKNPIRFYFQSEFITSSISILLLSKGETTFFVLYIKTNLSYEYEAVKSNRALGGRILIVCTVDVVFRQISTFTEDFVAIVYRLRGL